MVASLRLVLLSVLACVAVLVSSVSCQLYAPQPPVLSSCPSGSVLWSVGSSNSSAFTYHTEGSSYLYSNEIYLFNQYTVNVTGITLYQLSLGLLDNSALSNVAHLKLVLYTFAGGSYTLAATTPEISLWPSTDQVLYANLPQPVPLVVGVTYAFGVWADTNLFMAYSNVYQGGYTYYQTYYPSSPLASFTGCATCTYATRPLAAAGCQSTSDPLSASSGNTLYSFCGLVEYWQPTPATSVNYYDLSATTTLISYQGVLAVGATAAGSSAQGSYYTVLGAVGEYTKNAIGGYYPGSSTSPSNAASAFQLGTATNGANQAVYPGAAFGVDGSGLSLQLATGLTVTLQYNATTGKLQTVDSINGLVTGSYTLFRMQLYTGGATVQCNAVVNSTSGVAPVSCPSGSTLVQYGDSSAKDLYYYYSQDSTESYLYGNVLYTRPFTVQTSGTTLYQVSTLALWNPGHIIHILMGVYAATNLQTMYGYEVTGATMTLLATTAEFELVNGGDGLITLNLLTPLALNASTTYWLGIMADSYFYTGYSYYWYYPTLYQLYNKALPAQWQSTSANDVPQISASACVANTAAVTFSLCITFAYASTTTSYQGSIQAIPVAGMSGVYEALSGSGKVIVTTLSSGATVNSYNWTLQGLGQTYNQYIYTSSSAASVVDSVGFSLVYANPAQTTVQQTVIRYNAASQQYSESISNYYASTTITASVNRGSSVVFTQSSAPASCGVFSVPTNSISPAPAKQLTCALSVTYGDPISADYSSHAEGTSVSANTLYSVSFSGLAGTVVQQAQLSVLANYANIAAVRLGLYDSNGALLTQTAEYVLNGLVDQTLYLPLASPVTLSSVSYRIALWSNSSLNIANGAQSTSAAAVTYVSSGLPTSFTPSASGPSLPIAVLGCATPTHTMCGWWQYYFPSVGGSAPYAYTVLYNGLLFASSTATSTASGSGYQVYQATGHITPYTGGWAGGTPLGQSLPLSLSSAAGSTPQYVYQSGFGVDAAGLTFTSGSRQYTVRSINGAVNESSVSGAAALWSNFTVSAYSAATGVPGCGGIASLPHQVVGASTTVASCPSGQVAASFGDDKEADLADNTEFVYYSQANYLFLRPFTTGNASVQLSQLGFGINQNPNVVVKLKLGLYDNNNAFLVGTSEITIYNPQDDVVVAPLTAPYTLKPGTTYNIALWADTSVFNGFNSGGSPAMAIPYSSTTWPAVFVQSQANSVRAVQAFGCVVASSAGIGSSSSSSTGAAGSGGSTVDNSGSNGGGGSSLSNGQVAGIVIGCSIGVGLLTALCLLCVLRGLWAGASGGKASDFHHAGKGADSEVSKVELSHVHKGEVDTEA